MLKARLKDGGDIIIKMTTELHYRFGRELPRGIPQVRNVVIRHYRKIAAVIKGLAVQLAGKVPNALMIRLSEWIIGGKVQK